MVYSYRQLSRNGLVLSLTITILISVAQVRDNSISAEPSSTIQEILDPGMDWINMQTKQIDKDSGERSADIRAVNYYADRDFLNATLWLYFPFQMEPKYSKVNYGILIDSDFNNRTGYDGIDYKFEIGWDNKSRAWTKTLEAWSPTGETKTIDFQNNYTDFAQNRNYYVTLSLDLDQIHSPEKYKLIFYAEAQRDGVFFTDLTKWVAVPTPQVEITASPISIELSQGGQKTIELKLNSSQGYEPIVKLQAESRANGISFEFPQNDTVRIPSYGVATTPLIIKASPDLPLGPYTLFMSANSTFPPEQLITVRSDNEANSANGIPFIPPQPAEYIVAHASLVATILEPSTWVDELSSFWNKIGDPISFVYGALVGISPWIYATLKKRINNDKQKNKTESDNALQ